MSRVNKRSGDIDFLSIPEGGTGATSMAAFRTNNNILEKNSNKAVILGVGGAFPSDAIFTDDVADKPILAGSFEGIPAQELTFTITNFDSFTNYSVSSVDGSITISGAVIKFTPNNNASGNVTFTVNGAAYTVAVSSLNPTRPTLQVNGVSDGVATTLTVQGSGFTSPAGAVMSTMTVQVATDAGFATIVGNSNAGASVSIGVNSVGIFYVRAKFVDNASRESAWSSVATINSTSLPNSIGTPTMTVKAVKNGSGAKFDVVSSTFVESTGKTHKSTVYQVSDTAAFTTTIYDNTDTVNKLAKSFSVTDTKTTYYVRIKYISSNDGQSAWSDVFSMDRAGMPAGIPTNEEAKIVPSPSATYFGVSISITSDGSRVAVGAYGDKSAFIFSRSGSTWTQEAKIVPSPSATYFGISISITADGSRVAIGAYGDSSAFIFSRSGSTWTQEAKIVPSGSASYFGVSISITSDGSRVAVGAHGDNSAFIFSRTGTTWTQEAKIVPSPSATSFGYSISITSDGSRVAVGAHGDSSAFIFSRSGSTWTQEAKIVPSGSATNFGYSVSITSDGSRVAVGAYDRSAFIFSRSGSTWTQEAKIVPSPSATYFGQSVSITSDGSRVAVGAHGDKSAFIFS